MQHPVINRDGEEYGKRMCICDRVTLTYSTNEHDIVNQLCCSLEKNMYLPQE